MAWTARGLRIFRRERAPGQVSPAAVPDELDHRRKGAVDVPWRRQPSRDPITGVPAKANVPHRDGSVWSADLLAAHVDVVAA